MMVLIDLIICVWSVLRIRDPQALFGRYDAAGRLLFSTWQIYALMHGATPLIAIFLVFELAWGALAYIEPDGTWSRVNGSFCELLGYTEQELYGMTFQQLTHPDDLPGNLVLLERMLAGEIDRYELEKRVRHKDGRYIWVRARTSLQRHADGQPEHLISVFEDITAERDEHERLQAHIAGLQARLN